MRGWPALLEPAPALLALGGTLVAANWYLRPERAGAWAAAASVIGVLGLVFVLARRGGPESAGGRRDDPIAGAVAFAGLMLVVSLAARLLATLGFAVPAELQKRALMVVLGLFLVITGNAIPTTLTPLSALRCDAARLQALQRLAGWLWVLTGVAITGFWLAAPVGVARAATLALTASTMLASVAGVVRLLGTRAKQD